MTCTCTDYSGCLECRNTCEAAAARSYAQQADREAELREAEYRANCLTCPRCHRSDAFHGVCNDLECVSEGCRRATLTPAEESGFLCSICEEAVLCRCAECVGASGWAPGYWEGGRWCDPCCPECIDRELADVDGDYVRVEKGKAADVLI